MTPRNQLVEGAYLSAKKNTRAVFARSVQAAKQRLAEIALEKAARKAAAAERRQEAHRE